MCKDRPFVDDAEADRRRAFHILVKLSDRLKRLNRMKIPPTRDISVDVPSAVDKALSGDKWSRMTTTGVKLLAAAAALSVDEPFAEVLLIVAFMRHYMRVLEGWEGPPSKRESFEYAMNGFRHVLARFDAPCKYEGYGLVCENRNCPYAHRPKTSNDVGEAVKLLPSDDEFYAAMLA